VIGKFLHAERPREESSVIMPRVEIDQEDSSELRLVKSHR
jgi:hypothetical protein